MLKDAGDCISSLSDRSRGTSDFSLWGGNKFSGQTMGLVWRQKKRIGQTGEKKMSKRWDETKKCRLAGESPCSLNPPWRSFWAMTPSSWHQLPHGACKLTVCKMQGWGDESGGPGKTRRLLGLFVCPTRIISICQLYLYIHIKSIVINHIS